jgi:hypothetical protein
MDRLQIDEGKRKSAKFLIEGNGKGQYELLPDTISYLKLGVILNSGKVVYVDTSGASQDIYANGLVRSSGRYSTTTLEL